MNSFERAEPAAIVHPCDGTAIIYGEVIYGQQITMVRLFDERAARFYGLVPAAYCAKFNVTREWDRRKGYWYTCYTTAAKRPLTSDERLYFKHLVAEAAS